MNHTRFVFEVTTNDYFKVLIDTSPAFNIYISYIASMINNSYPLGQAINLMRNYSHYQNLFNSLLAYVEDVPVNTDDIDKRMLLIFKDFDAHVNNGHSDCKVVGGIVHAPFSELHNLDIPDDDVYRNIQYPVIYFSSVSQYKVGKLFKDYVYQNLRLPHNDKISQLIEGIYYIDNRNNNAFVDISDPSYMEKIVIMAAAIVKPLPILPTSSPFTRAVRGLYEFARVCSAQSHEYPHPVDYIGHIVNNKQLSELRVTAMTEHLVKVGKIKKEAKLDNCALDSVLQDCANGDITDAEINTVLHIVSIMNADEDEDGAQTIGGAPNTPLDILKELLVVLKEDTQKLAGHYDALRRHLVQFAQNINNADVPHSKAPVDYSGLMEKYQELYRENEKLRRANTKLRETKKEQEKPAAPLLVAQLAQMAKDDDLARSLKKTYIRPVSRRDANDSDAMMVMRALRDIVDALPQPR